MAGALTLRVQRLALQSHHSGVSSNCTSNVLLPQEQAPDNKSLATVQLTPTFPVLLCIFLAPPEQLLGTNDPQCYPLAGPGTQGSHPTSRSCLTGLYLAAMATELSRVRAHAAF
jgi:hypothetical protein